MSGVIETVEVVEPWLYARISSDSVITDLVADRVYGTFVDSSVDERHVIFALNSPRDVVGVGRARIILDALYVAKAVAPTSSWDDLTPVAKRLDELLHGAVEQAVELEGDVVGYIAGCRREQIVQYPQEEAGAQWRHLGGLYRIWAHAA